MASFLASPDRVDAWPEQPLLGPGAAECRHLEDGAFESRVGCDLAGEGDPDGSAIARDPDPIKATGAERAVARGRDLAHGEHISVLIQTSDRAVSAVRDVDVRAPRERRVARESRAHRLRESGGQIDRGAEL